LNYFKLPNELLLKGDYTFEKYFFAAKDKLEL